MGFWSLLAPVIILGGIYTGFFTPTEAAIVSIFYTLFVGIFIYKEIELQGVMKALESTTWITGRVLIIMFTALAFGQLLTINKIPDLIAQGLLDLTGNLYLIWVLIIIFLLFMGMFMETLATIMLVTPCIAAGDGFPRCGPHPFRCRSGLLLRNRICNTAAGRKYVYRFGCGQNHVGRYIDECTAFCIRQRAGCISHRLFSGADFVAA